MGEQNSAEEKRRHGGGIGGANRGRAWRRRCGLWRRMEVCGHRPVEDFRDEWGSSERS